MSQLLYSIRGLKYCRIDVWANACFTHFPDGEFAPAIPHPHDPHYCMITQRCGYGAPTEVSCMQYCIEHEFAHAFVEQELYDRPSRVLWGVAHKKPLRAKDAVYEEFMAQGFQRWLRKHERPIIGGVDWDELKLEARGILTQAVEKMRVGSAGAGGTL